MVKNNQEINIWELGDNVNVKLNKDFLSLINKKISQRFTTKRNAHGELKLDIPFSTFKSILKISYPYFVDLKILVPLCLSLGIAREDLQNNVIAYKIRKSNNYWK